MQHHRVLVQYLLQLHHVLKSCQEFAHPSSLQGELPARKSQQFLVQTAWHQGTHHQGTSLTEREVALRFHQQP